MLIAEDLLLLLTDDATGKLCLPVAQVDLALAGASLIELALMNRIELAPDQDDHRKARVVVRDSAPTGDDVLDVALEALDADPAKRPEAAVRTLAKHVRERLYVRLVAGGLLRSESTRTWGIFPTKAWPAADSGHEAELRRVITDTLVRALPTDAHTAALIALLRALRAEQQTVDMRPSGLSKVDVRARAAQVADGNWAADAVRKAVDEILAAVIAATTAAASTVVLPGAS